MKSDWTHAEDHGLHEWNKKNERKTNVFECKKVSFEFFSFGLNLKKRKEKEKRLRSSNEEYLG